MATTLPNMGLIKWNSTSDYFSHTQLAANFQYLDDHDHSSGKGLQIPTGGIATGAITGAKIATNAVTASHITDGTITGVKLVTNTITGDKFATADLQKLGLSDSVVRRGKSIITGVGTRTNTAYGALDAGAAPGPDRVQNVVLPTDGLLFVAYQATWQETNVGAARAAIFVGSNQVQVATGTEAGTYVQETTTPAVAANQDHPLATSSRGLISPGAGGSSAYTGDVATGQLIGMAQDSSTLNGFVGGPCVMFAAGGVPYDVSVQFRATSGTVTVKNRKLWVWTMGF